MLAGSRRVAPPGSAAGTRKVKRMPVEPGRDDVLGADVGVGGEAVGQRPAPPSAGHPADARIVGIEDGDAVGGKGLDELGLRVLDRIDRSDPAQVHPEDGRDDADPRPRHAGEVADLAADVHPHLEHRGLVVRAQPQDRQRQADLVVLVALASERPPIGREHGGDGLLRGRLGDAPRDPDDQRVEALPPAGRDGVERREARPAPGRRSRRRGPRARRAPARRPRGGPPRPADAAGAKEAVPVRALARERHEQLARPDEPRVHGGPADRSVGGPEERARRSARRAPGRVSAGAADAPPARAGTSRGRGDGRSVTSGSVAQAPAPAAAAGVADRRRPLDASSVHLGDRDRLDREVREEARDARSRPSRCGGRARTT